MTLLMLQSVVDECLTLFAGLTLMRAVQVLGNVLAKHR